MIYHDTNWMSAEPPEVVAKALADNVRQDKRVALLFKELPHAEIPIFMVRRWCFPPGSAESNAGRAVNTLTRQGLLIKLPKAHMIMGDRGKKVHTWRKRTIWDTADADGVFIGRKTQQEVWEWRKIHKK